MEDKQINNSNSDKKELEKMRMQAEEYLNNWKRERADFINYKKEEAKRVEEIIKFANESVILELIEVLDNLEIVRKNFPDGAEDKTEEWLDKLDKSIKEFEEFLNRHGVERIKIGDKFDPMLNEAIEVEEKGNKLVEVRAGYTMRDKVIRPARVKIVKN